MIQIIMLPILFLFVLMNAYAADPYGVGHVAQNMMEPVNLLTETLRTVCYVIGGAFLFTAIIKYFEHRRSPLMVPISTVVFLLIAGVLLILLPFVPMLNN